MKMMIAWMTTLAVAAASVAQAGVVGPKRASDLVSVNASGLAICPSGGPGSLIFDQRIGADGVTAGSFTIPPGRVLVITGLDWRIVGATPNTLTGATIRLDAGFTISTPFFDTMTADANGGAGRSIPIANVVVQPGVTICLLAGGPAAAMSGVLHGYFANDN